MFSNPGYRITATCVRALPPCAGKSSRETARALFTALDENGSGIIHTREFTRVFGGCFGEGNSEALVQLTTRLGLQEEDLLSAIEWLAFVEYEMGVPPPSVQQRIIASQRRVVDDAIAAGDVRYLIPT